MSFSYNWTKVDNAVLISIISTSQGAFTGMSYSGQYQWIFTNSSFWYSTNYGITWSQSNGGDFYSPASNPSQTYTIMPPSNTGDGKKLVIGSWNSGRIVRSNNYGVTWFLDTSNNWNSSNNVTTIAMSKYDGKYVTLTSNSVAKVYTSSDYGVTYTERYNSTLLRGGTFVSSNGQYQYTLTGFATGVTTKLYFSSNYGISWSTLYQGPINSNILMYNSYNGKNILLTIPGYSTVLLSTNYGTTFKNIFTTFDTYSGAMSSDLKYIVLGNNVTNGTVNAIKMAYSNDNGNTFNTSVNAPQHLDRIVLSYTGSYGLAIGSYYGGGWNLYTSNMRSTIACLLEGTLVKTPTGYVPIETLKEGDLIRTYDSDIPITKVGKWVCDIQKDSGNLSKKMYKIPAGELRTNKDTYISHYHRILVVDFSHPKNPLLFRLPNKIGLKEANPEEFTKKGKYTIYHLQIKEGQFFVVNGDCCVEAWKANAKFF